MVEIILGRRPYEHPNSKLSVELDRIRFLEAMEEFAPDALRSLSEEPLASYRETGIPQLDLIEHRRFGREQSEFRNISSFWYRLENGWVVCEYYLNGTRNFLHPACAAACELEAKKRIAKGLANEIYFLFTPSYDFYPQCPQMAALWRSLTTWAKTYGLIERENEPKWLLQSAFYTLDHWARHPAEMAKVFMVGSKVYQRQPYVWRPEPPDGFREYHADWEDRDDYISQEIERVREEASEIWFLQDQKIKRDVVASIRNQLDDYCDRVEKKYRADGWKKSRERPAVLKHAEWAVRVYVNKESLYSLQMSQDKNRANIKREVEKFYDSIGLVRNRLGSPT